MQENIIIPNKILCEWVLLDLAWLLFHLWKEYLVSWDILYNAGLHADVMSVLFDRVIW